MGDMTLMAFVGAALGPARAIATVFVGATIGAVAFLAIVYPIAMLRRGRVDDARRSSRSTRPSSRCGFRSCPSASSSPRPRR